MSALPDNVVEKMLADLETDIARMKQSVEISERYSEGLKADNVRLREERDTLVGANDELYDKNLLLEPVYQAALAFCDDPNCVKHYTATMNKLSDEVIAVTAAREKEK